MTDDTRMVDLPWIDGTTRTVPEWTTYESQDKGVAYARDGGYSYRPNSGELLFAHHSGSRAVRILTEAPEPSVKVDVPTGIAAVVSTTAFPHIPFCVLTQDGWLGLLTRRAYDPSEIADRLRAGARVLYEGVDE
jgi:hypothetical protein